MLTYTKHPTGGAGISVANSLDRYLIVNPTLWYYQYFWYNSFKSGSIYQRCNIWGSSPIDSAAPRSQPPLHYVPMPPWWLSKRATGKQEDKPAELVPRSMHQVPRTQSGLTQKQDGCTLSVLWKTSLSWKLQEKISKWHITTMEPSEKESYNEGNSSPSKLQ